MTIYIGLAIELIDHSAEVRVVKVSSSHDDIMVACEVEARSECDYIDGIPMMIWNHDRTKLDLSDDLGITYHIVSQ